MSDIAPGGQLPIRTPVLAVQGLKTGYGQLEVLHGIDIEVGEGELVALVGANGAGKTTLLGALSGLQPVWAGSVIYNGRAINRLSTAERVGLGITQVPEGRQVFAPLSVEDNLILGSYARGSADGGDLKRIYALFPSLKEKRHIAAGLLSGGQQQMLAVGRALMARPKVLLLDEPSMGLAPILVQEILRTVLGLKRDGLTIVLVEQNAHLALGIADRGYVLETGKIVNEGTGSSLLNDRNIREAYLGR